MTVVIDPSLAPPSGVTLDSLVTRVQQMLTNREDLNELNENIDPTTTSIKLRYTPSAIARGTEVSIDNEICYVWTVDSATQTLTVRRGYGGTNAEEHSVNAIVRSGGKSRRQIVDAINDELSTLSGKGLYQMRAKAIDTYSPSTYSYVLDDIDVAHIYDVQCLELGQTSEWVHLRGWSFSAFDSAITLGSEAPTRNVRVLYKAGFDKFESGDDDLQANVGLHAEAADILVYGAVSSLVLPDELSRVDMQTQGDTRRPSEVPTGATLRVTAALTAKRDQRISDEKDRLRRKFPTRRSGW